MAIEATSRTLPRFTLTDGEGNERTFPTGRHALLCFVKEDCPTCRLSMPLIEAASRAFGEALDVWAIGQDAPGNARLVEGFNLSVPMLDDSALKVSYVYDLDTVPTIILADGSGAPLRQFVGFDKAEWLELVRELARLSGGAAPAIDWASYPASRPGCGSKSVEPGIAERLAAEAAGSPLRARRIEVGEGDDVFEFMFDQGLTDGLPVIPPTPERVLRMLQGTRRDPQEVVAVVPPNLAPATVEKVAANTVMAGCKPEYLPVVIAALEAVCTDTFNIHGINATTWAASPVIVVNGPIRERIGMNYGLMALGYGNRANATIGRALKLCIRNLGGARPGGTERSVLGSPGKYTMCFAEHEARSPWEPLHVERGFRPEQSVVTVFGLEASPRHIADQLSRTARQLGGSLGLGLEACWLPKAHGQGDVLLVVCPEHVDTLWRDRWTKNQLRERIQEITARPVRELLGDEQSGEGIPSSRFGPGGPSEEELNRRVPKFRSPENIHIVVAGGEGGKFSSVFAGWVSGPTGSSSVSRVIEDV
ncbi:MAG TPA: TlpA family protein disulfide reductase [Dehalococcoidia bacterium]|nr:TlpA family protein disulfide reductase [Dehalococcoidia bacterium]